MAEKNRFPVAAFNRASIATLMLVFVSILALTTAMLGGASRSVALGVTTALLALILAHMARSSIRLDADALRVGAGLFRKRIPYSEIIAIAETQRPRLGWRLNGIGFPGFALGWFSGTGGRRLFVAAGDRRSAFLRLSLRGSCDVVVSVTQSVGLEQALRSRLTH